MTPRRVLVALMTMSVLASMFVLPAISRPVAATAPTITAYDIIPANAGIGTCVRVWLTYTDADNDAPTYVRCTRTTITGFAQLQTPNTMLANNSGDTTYSDGKQYYYDWYYFPFVGTGFIKFMVKSGAEAEVSKTHIEYQEPAPTLTHSGVAPVGDLEDNYSFFTNYTDAFNGVPSYVQITIDGTVYPMGKNNSTQLTWTTGVDYNYTMTLGAGNHTYSFSALSRYGYSGPQTSGNYWLVIQPSPYDWTSAVLMVLTLSLGFGLLAIGFIKREYLVLSGLVWIFSAVAVFPEYGAGWTVISLGLGMYVIAEGGLAILDDEKESTG